jgi:hypothetical protein
LDGVARADVQGRDIENFPIMLVPDFTLRGRFVMEGSSRSYPQVVEVRQDPAFVGISRGSRSYDPPAADGSFAIEGMSPGDFRVALQGVPADGYVKSMRLGGVDVLNDGLHLTGSPEAVLDIVIGANAGKIEGTVNAGLQPLANRTVVLVPDLRLRQRTDLYKMVSTDNAGRFRMQGVTPGEYKLFAWDNVEPGAWQDPAFIGAYENAGRPIHIYEGSNENVQLTVIP